MEFRVLVETPDALKDRSVLIDGARWSLTEPIDRANGLPRYSCISYVWGTGRVENPIHPIYSMSDRTLPVLTAAMRNLNLRAFWIDAFCIPADPRVRRATLESMGFIYAHATNVVVVLSSAGFAALEEICAWDPSSAPHPDGVCLGKLEADMWIRSAWAYQEVVNSGALWFVGDDGRRHPLKAQDVLNKLGHCLVSYERSHSITTRHISALYPRLDALQELLLDWMTFEFEERSVLQVMSGMSRLDIIWRDYKAAFYSMIGAVTQQPSSRTAAPTLESLSEAFMAVCEDKGDYCFVFSTAERDARPGFRWRPRPDVLRSILPWHCYGDRQSARVDSRGVWLLDMAVLPPSTTIAPQARKVISLLLHDDALENASEGDIASRTKEILTEMGFCGNGEAILTSAGVVHPQHRLPTGLQTRVAIATRLKRLVGNAAPALVLVSRIGGGIEYSPGVFIGAVPRDKLEELLLE